MARDAVGVPLSAEPQRGRLGRLGLAATLLGVVAILSVACAPPAPPPSGPVFVGRSGSRLTLAGQPWGFVGMNVYNMSSTGDCWYPMAGTGGLAEAVAASGSTVVRGWFYQPMVADGGQIDWGVFDDTLARARSAGVRVVVTLADHWAYCESGGEKAPSWYETGYAADHAADWPSPGDPLPLTYREYVAAIVARYRDDPTILAWQPVNEPQVCGAGGADTLLSFTDDVTSLIKSLDPNHLVSLGTIGSGQCGTSMDEYRTLHDLPAVDWCEIHDYYGPTGTTLPGDQWNGVGVRFDQCAAIDKPVVFGEIGIRLDQTAGGTTQERAYAFAEKLDTYRAAGATGALVWDWVDAAHLPDTYGIGPGDPSLGVIGAAAVTWASGP